MAGLPPPPINDRPGSFTWLEWYRQLRNYVSTSGSVPWYIINFSGSNITDIAARDHADLQGKQGGTAGEHYHLTSAEHTDIGLLTDRSYGEMYMYNGAISVTVSATNTWYKVASGFSGGVNKNFTFQSSSELKCTKAGTYTVQWSISPEISSANQDTEYAVAVNGTAQTKTAAHLHFQNTNSELCAASGGILTLAVDDVLSLVLQNNTSTTNVTVQHANLTAVRIDT